MFLAAIICSALLALAFAGTGIQKLSGRPVIVEGLGRLGVSPPLVRLIGLLELGDAAGALLGLSIAWLGVATACGLAALMAGAILHHTWAGDYGEPDRRGPALMPVALLLLAVGTAVLRAASARSCAGSSASALQLAGLGNSRRHRASHPGESNV